MFNLKCSAPGSTVLMVWLGLGTKNMWLGLEKHHVLEPNTTQAGKCPNVSWTEVSNKNNNIFLFIQHLSSQGHKVLDTYRLVREGIHVSYECDIRGIVEMLIWYLYKIQIRKYPWFSEKLKCPNSNSYATKLCFNPSYDNQRKTVTACMYLIIITGQSGLLLFPQHVLLPLWQKVGNECICIDPAPPFCPRCPRVPDVFHAVMNGIKRTGVCVCVCVWVCACSCPPPSVCERECLCEFGRGDCVVPRYW